MSALRAWRRWKQLERSASTPGPKYCDRCGTANRADAAYCVGCGQALNY